MYMRMTLYVHMCACAHVRMCGRGHICGHARTCAPAYVNHVNACKCIRAYMRKYAQGYMHARGHVREHVPAQAFLKLRSFLPTLTIATVALRPLVVLFAGPSDQGMLEILCMPCCCK